MGSETREAVAGRALIFDDSFEHEAWNDSGSGTGIIGDENDVGNDTENGDGSLSSGEEGVPEQTKAEPRREGGPVAEGEGRNCRLGEETGRGDTKGTSLEGEAAPRVTLIADVWHPDLSSR